MSKADRRVDSAICLPLSGISHKLHAPERLGAHSSAGQSYRLITGWSLVRIQVGPPQFSDSRFNRLNSIGVEQIK
jgi:hypothetical protein